MQAKHQPRRKSNVTIYIEILVRAALKGGATAALLLGSILVGTSSNAAEDARDNLKAIEHIIVIYQENWSFDSLYGQFPGANGYANCFNTLPQLNVKATPASELLIP
jgi:phospholipase C